MKKLFFALAAGLLLTSGLSACAPADSSNEWPEKLVFAAINQDPTVDVQDQYQLLIDLFEKELGIEVEFYKSTDTAVMVEGLAADRIDLAFFGPYGYVLAKQRTEDVAIIGMQARGADVTPGTYNLAITNSGNTAINSIADFKGKTVCFGDPAGATFLYSAKGLADAGIDPKIETTKDITPVVVGTTNTATALVAGDCEASFVLESILNSQYASGTVDKADIKSVWKSELVPGAPLVIRTTLPKDLQEKISNLVLTKANKTAFVESGVCSDEASCQFLTSVNWGFVAGNDDFEATIREACLAIGNKECK